MCITAEHCFFSICACGAALAVAVPVFLIVFAPDQIISETTKQFFMTFCTDIHGSQRMNHNGFPGLTVPQLQLLGLHELSDIE